MAGRFWGQEICTESLAQDMRSWQRLRFALSHALCCCHALCCYCCCCLTIAAHRCQSEAMKSAAHGLKAGSQVRRAPTLLLLLLLGWAPQRPGLLWRLSRRVRLELLCGCLLSSMLAIPIIVMPLHAGSPLHRCCSYCCCYHSCCCCCVLPSLRLANACVHSRCVCW